MLLLCASAILTAALITCSETKPAKASNFLGLGYITIENHKDTKPRSQSKTPNASSVPPCPCKSCHHAPTQAAFSLTGCFQLP